MVKSRITITMNGQLPYNAFSDKFKSAIEERLQDEVIDTLGEYEIWGEFFGSDEDVYTLFLDEVILEEAKENDETTVNDLESRLISLQGELETAQDELQTYRNQPKKYSINELDITYDSSPFCEHCGENYSNFGATIPEPDGGTAWCLPCFTNIYDMCEQDVELIEKRTKKEERAYHKKKLKKS